MIRHASIALAVVASAVILAALQETTPTYAVITGPIRTTGQQGDTVTTTTFSATIKGAVKAHKISYRQFGREVSLESSGVWVVVFAELSAFQKTIAVRAATMIGATGRLYRQSRRAGGAPNVLSTKTLQPGLPTTGIFVFELPEDETQEMELVLSEQYDPQLRDQIGLPLKSDEIATQQELKIAEHEI